MNRVLVLLSVFAVAFGRLPAGFRTKFGQGPGAGTDYYHKLPRTVAEAKQQGWAQQQRPQNHLPQLTMYCAPELTVCVLYDDTDFVAGIQVALSEDIVSGSPYTWESQGYTKWTPANGKTYWTAQAFFISKETFEISPEDRKENRDDSTIHEDEIWVTGTSGELVKLPVDAKDIPKQSKFVEESCFPGMGLHYFYDMTEKTECNAKSLLPWFGLVNDGKLVGVGFNTFGTLKSKAGERQWLEVPPSGSGKAIIPRGPQCLYDLWNKSGSITLHTYFTDTPEKIAC